MRYLSAILLILFELIILATPVLAVPKACFKATPLYGNLPKNEGFKVELDASCSTSNIIDYQWDISDGSKSSGEKASIHFTKKGRYNITLKVTDNSGNSDTDANVWITVGELCANVNDFPDKVVVSPLLKEIPLNITICEPAPLSIPEDGYQWTVVSNDPENDPECEQVQPIFDGKEERQTMSATKMLSSNKSCAYTVTFTLTDVNGLSVSSDYSLVVEMPSSPIATIKEPIISIDSQSETDVELKIDDNDSYLGAVPLTIKLDGSASYSPAGFSINKYTWTFSCVLNSGQEISWEPRITNDSSIKWTFSSVGECSVELVVTDDHGLNSIITKVPISVREPPTAIAEVSPTENVTTSTTIQLDGTGSKGDIEEYKWASNGSIIASNQNANKLFQEPGIYNITLTVIDKNGLTDTSQEIRLNVINPLIPVLQIESSSESKIFKFPSEFFLKNTSKRNRRKNRKNLVSYGDTSKNDYWQGRVIVQFYEGTQEETKHYIRNNANATLIKTLPLINAEVWEVKDVKSAITEQQRLAHPEIEYVGPDYVIYMQRTTRGSKFEDELWSLKQIGAEKAWKIVKNVKPQVCAVIDTGVDVNHPDLAPNMWYNMGEVSELKNGRDDDGDGIVDNIEELRDGKDNDNNGFVDDIHGADFFNNTSNILPKPHDKCRHGTHVAGIMAGIGDEKTGLPGVSPLTKIMVLKVSEEYEEDEYNEKDKECAISNSAVIDALTYAINKGVRCSINSWGFNVYDKLLSDAIKAVGEKGHLFITVAGNKRKMRKETDIDQEPYYPASYASEDGLKNIISVCSTKRNDRLASHSYHGQTTVDLCAPGQEIYSTVPGKTYDSISGTSMAAPHVAGVVMLIWSAFPNLTLHEIKMHILASVKHFDHLNSINNTGGRLDAYKAVLSAQSQIHTFTFKNVGQEGSYLTIKREQLRLVGENKDDFKIRHNDSCEFPLGYNETCTVDVVFHPYSKIADESQYQATLEIHTDVEQRQTGELTFLGELTKGSDTLPAIAYPSVKRTEPATIDMSMNPIVLEMPRLTLANSTNSTNDGTNDYVNGFLQAKLCLMANSGDLLTFQLCENGLPKEQSLPKQLDDVIFYNETGVLEIPVVAVKVNAEAFRYYETEIKLKPSGFEVTKLIPIQ